MKPLGGLLFAGLLLGSVASPLRAQEADPNAPLSAIPWLSESLETPRETAPLIEAPAQPAPPTGQIDVIPLDQVRRGTTGLISAASVGLPDGIWAGSDPKELAKKVRSMPALKYPALEKLFSTLMLVEAPAPAGAGDDLLLARVDALMLRAQLDPAMALLERAGPDTPALFRRWFDLGLLTGTEDRACATLQAKPDLTPNYATRIFCLARLGRWPTAALTLETAAALKAIDENTLDRLTRFLDPELFEGLPPAIRPDPVTPLDFRLLEAVGEPVPTSQLPLAFAWSDLRHVIGWKSQLEAGERLASAGALQANALLGLYTLRQPAASGGVWHRVGLIQALDIALTAGDTARITTLLEPSYQAMKSVGLSAVFAEMFAARLTRLPLRGQAELRSYQLVLMSNGTDAFVPPVSDIEEFPDDLQFLSAVASGEISPILSNNSALFFITEGFTLRRVPLELDLMLKDDKLGEALLETLYTLAPGSPADENDKAAALAFLISVGQLQTARHAALQIILMDASYE